VALREIDLDGIAYTHSATTKGVHRVMIVLKDKIKMTWVHHCTLESFSLSSVR